MIPGRAVAGLALALALAPIAVHAAGTAPRAAGAPGGRGLLEAIESLTLTVVGRIEEVKRLDTHGYAARIRVERGVGPQHREGIEGESLRLAFEELAGGRPPRFASGDRVLVVLEPLGTASIWRKRIPDPDERRDTFGVAMQGDAFLRDPIPASVDLLHHYLSIAPEARAGPAGVRLLASLAAGAQPPLALAAARRLAGTRDLEGVLDGPAEGALVEALARGDAGPELSALLVSAAGKAAGESLARRLSGAVADRSPPPPAALFEALARCSAAGLAPADLDWLLARPEAVYREVVARTASREQGPVLRRLAGDDPDPAVRAAALLRLRALLGAEALPVLLEGLADPEPAVRAAAARGAGSLGHEAVGSLRAVAFGRDASDAARRAAVAGLRLAGASGRPALVEIARDHPDPGLRRLADLALGRLDTQAH